jgi:hypothetical protein
MRRARVMGAHVCGYYCRDGRHAGVVYTDVMPDDECAETLAEWARNVGLRLVHHEPAREDDGDMGDGPAFWPSGKPAPNAVDGPVRAWLVVWETDEPGAAGGG